MDLSGISSRQDIVPLILRVIQFPQKPGRRVMDTGKLIEQINDDIFEIVTSYIKLKKSGAGYKASCPFHDEKTASFHLTPAKGIFKCFGCGKGGNAIHFIMEYESVDFKQAVEIGAKKLDVDFSWKKAAPYDQEKHRHIESLHVACNIVEQFFFEKIAEQKPSQYLEKRNISVPENSSFNIGYAPPGNALLIYAREKGVKPEILEEIGVLKSNNIGIYDFFKDRLVFPISNPQGQTIAFAGRSLEANPQVKYLNTPESCIYKKGNELYGLNEARFEIKKADRAYIVEGYTDALRMHSIEVNNTIATCGTALTENQAKLLKRYSNKTTLIFDGDIAGRLASDRNAEILIKNQFHVSVIELPEKQDPDTLFTTKDVFLEYNEKQTDYTSNN
jgi:DNA primase catalytic core